MKKKMIPGSVLLLVLLIMSFGFETLTARSYERAPAITYIRKGSPEAPYITGIHIYENGRVRLIDKMNGTGRRYINIPQSRVRRLLDLIVRKQDFFSISMADIRAIINSREQMLDASTTHISVWCRKGSHQVSIYHFRENSKSTSNKMARLRVIVRELEKLREETSRQLR